MPLPVKAENHCPLKEGKKCRDPELDENGYCRHLVGFMNVDPDRPLIGQKIDAIVRTKRNLLQVDSTIERQYQDGDMLVNPESIQIIEGVRHLVKKWVSARVYRENYKCPSYFEEPKKAKAS